MSISKIKFGNTTESIKDANAYVKPSTGIPASDLASEVQTSLGKAESAYQKTRTETKPDQEFRFRKTGVDWDARAELIKKFKGKTLAWNQLMINPNFNGSSGWDPGVSATSISASNNVMRVTAGSDGVANMSILQLRNITSGHKYFIKYEVQPYTKTGTFYTGYFYSTTQWFSSIDITSQNVKTKVSTIVTANADKTRVYIGLYRGAKTSEWSSGGYVDYSNVVVVDLTLMFGAGNEPSTIAEFEALFPEPYYPYNAGTLISNDTKEFETVGFNQWDEEWEQGNIVSTTGQNGSSTTLIRSKNWIAQVPGVTSYYLASPASLFFRWYDASGNYIPFDTSYTDVARRNETFTWRTGAAYLRLVWTATAYNNDICINISDAYKNGTYEPYKKSTLPLNLQSFKVKSQNIWDEEYTLTGLNDDGTPFTGSTYLTSKNYIPVKPSTTYYFYKGGAIPSNLAMKIVQYNTNKTKVGTNIAKQGSQIPFSFTTDANCYYIKFNFNDYYGTTYANDICINISSSFNGQYEPHGILTMTGGLGGNGTWADEIVGNKYIKKTFDEDLGNKTWQKASTTSAYGGYFFMAPASKSKVGWHSHVIAARFKSISGLSTTEDNTISINATPVYCIQCSSCATAEAFKNAMNGVHAIYELATPIEYELVAPIPDFIRCDKDGTERAIGPESDTPSAPFVADIQYGVDSGDVAEEVGRTNDALTENKIWVRGEGDHSAVLDDDTITWSTKGMRPSLELTGAANAVIYTAECPTAAENYYPVGTYLTIDNHKTYGKILSIVSNGSDSYTITLSSTLSAIAINGVDISHVGETNANKASGKSSIAHGFSNVALGDYSHAEGNGTTASGNGSHAEGGFYIEEDDIDVSGGIASGNASHAEGVETTASGNASHAEGVGTQALNQGEHACGRYNRSYTISGGRSSLFTIGCGTASSRRNAVMVNESGQVFIYGTGYNGSTTLDYPCNLSHILNTLFAACHEGTVFPTSIDNSTLEDWFDHSDSDIGECQHYPVIYYQNTAFILESLSIMNMDEDGSLLSAIQNFYDTYGPDGDGLLIDTTPTILAVYRSAADRSVAFPTSGEVYLNSGPYIVTLYCETAYHGDKFIDLFVEF